MVNNGASQVNTPAETTDELDLLQIIGIVRRKWILIAIAGICGVAFAVLLNYFTPRTYESNAHILVEQQRSVGGQLAFLGTEDSQKLENRLQVIRSPVVLDEAIALLTTWGQQEATEDLRSRLTVSTLARTDVIQVSILGGSPEIAKFSVDAVVEAYQSYVENRAKEQAVRVQEFLIDQVARSLERVESAERAVRDFQQRVGIIFLSSEEQKVNQHIANLETRLMSAEISLAEQQMLLNHTEAELARVRQELPRSLPLTTEQVITELQKELASLEATRIDFLTRGLADTPEIRMLDRRIEGMSEQIRSHLDELAQNTEDTRSPLHVYRELVLEQIRQTAEITGLENRITLLTQRIAEYEEDLWRLSDKAFEYARLEREVTVNNRTYGMLSEELERSRIAVEREIGDVYVIQPARVSKSPVSPRVRLNLAIGLVLGLFIGVGSVFTFEFLDNSVKHRAQLEQMGLPLLGAIPKVKRTKSEVKKGDRFLLRDSDATDPLAAAYVRVESNLRFASFDNPPKVISCTSATPGEGKSTTILNLAYVLAHSGQRVLVIDGDLRIPVVHKELGESRKPGLSEVVSGQMDRGDGIRQIALGAVSCDVLTAGTRPPSIIHMCRSSSFRDLLAAAREQYDWVLVDMPPIQAGSEALEVSLMADGALLVIEAGRTPVQVVAEAKIQLDQAGVRTLGAVLNRYDPTKGGYGYGYGYGYAYYHYYREEASDD